MSFNNGTLVGVDGKIANKSNSDAESVNPTAFWNCY